MFRTYFYTLDMSYFFDTLDEAIKYGFEKGFEFIVQDETTHNIVFQ